MGYKSVKPSPLFFSLSNSDNSQVPYSITKLSIYPFGLLYKKRSSNSNNAIRYLVKKMWNLDSSMIEDNCLSVEFSICLKARLLLCESSLDSASNTLPYEPSPNIF